MYDDLIWKARVAAVDQKLDKPWSNQMSSPVQIDRMLQFFAYAHLPPDLQKVSKPFCDLAFQICKDLPSNPERTVALRKLLEAKDCAVRAVLYKVDERMGHEK